MAITFQTMPVAAPIDAANMPHVLGDTADVTWQGVAERTTANFAAFNTWAASIVTAAHPTLLKDAAVIGPSAGWSLTGGWARASYLTLTNGAKFVSLSFALVRTSGTIINSGPNGAFDAAVPIGTIAATIAPVGSTAYHMRWNGQLLQNTSDGSNRTLWCVADGGQVSVVKASGANTLIKSGSQVRFGASYLTKVS